LSLIDYSVNCFLLVIPVLIWNALFSRRLPAAYQPEIWDKVPKTVTLIEDVLRMVVLFGTLLLRLEICTTGAQIGLALYGIGTTAYFLSWILQIAFPKGKWSKSMCGFAAPAYTPLLWLAGIGLIGQELTVGVGYRCWIYMLLSSLFVGLHVTHAIMVYRSQSGRAETA